MKRTLFIIGNGFDLHHSIDSSYSHFKAHCERNNEHLHNLLTSLYDQSLWSDFEANLSHIEVDYLLDRYKDEGWNTSYKGIYGFIDGISDEVNRLKESIDKEFYSWIQNLNRGKSEKRLFVHKKEYLYLTFNYTDTLEYLYGVHEEDILYIHGKANKPGSELIYGHNKPDVKVIHSVESDDIFESEARDEIATYIISLRKKTEKVIKEHESFFSNLRDIEQIIVLGLSCSDIDLPYLSKIKENTKSGTEWLVSYYRDKDGNDDSGFIKENISKLSLPNVKLMEISSFKNNFASPSLFPEETQNL